MAFNSNLGIICLLTVFALISGSNGEVTLSALENVVANQGEVIANLEAQVSVLSEAQCTCDSKKDKIVAFQVSMANPSVHTKAHAVIPFANVMTNIGNGYSTATNSFTVPMDGVYVFYAKLDCSLDYRAFNIAVNGTIKGMAHNDADDHSLAASVTVIVSKGDIVDVRHDRDGSGSIDGGMESMFSGFRLGDTPVQDNP